MAAAVASASWPSQAVHHRSSSSSASSSSSCSAHHKAASSSSRRSSRTSHAATEHAPHQHDRFYGHRDLAELCERVILALFSCPLDSTSSSVSSSSTPMTKAAPRLSEFIAYALHRTRLPLAVTHQALFLLKRLKSRFPAARGSSGHRLFISALMLASKSTCDDTYSNKSWTIVGQGLFSLREVNQMERELFGYLGFRVNVEIEELDDFVAGLEQGRIHAPIEPPSPDMSTAATEEAFEVAQHDDLAVDDVEIAAAANDVVSPSAASEPCFPERYATSASAFNSRASIAGYPSSMASHPMVSSNSVPGASSSDTALDRTAASYATQHHYQHHQQHHHEQHHGSHQRAFTVPSQHTHLCVPGAAPAVSMAPYYHPGSPSSSRGSISYGSVISSADSAISPYDSAASSSRTTPETPASEFVDSPTNGSSGADGSDDIVWDAVDPLDVQGAPAGTYDDGYAAYHHQQPARHHSSFKTGAPRFTADPFASSRGEAQKSAAAAATAAAYRYQEQQQQRQHAYGTHHTQWSS